MAKSMREPGALEDLTPRFLTPRFCDPRFCDPAVL